MQKISATILKSKEEAESDMSLSVSKTKTFEECKAKFRCSYILKLPRKDQDFHIFGKFLHKILETFHRDMISDPSSNWQDVLDHAWDTSLQEYKNIPVLPLTSDQESEAKEIVNEYRVILKEEGLPKVIAVESPFYIDLNGRVLLNGFIDRIQLDSDNVIHVGDYKTTKDKKYLKDFFQLKTYAYAIMTADPSIERVRASFITLRHSFDYLTQTFTRKDVMPVAEKFLKTADDIDAEMTWRPNPGFLCKYCDYLDQCKQAKSYLIKKGILSSPQPTIGLTKW